MATEAHYKVYRRFSDWLWLYDQLSDEFFMHLLPPRPPKKFLGSLSSDFINYRLLLLQAFTDIIVENPALAGSRVVKAFLCENTEEWDSRVRNSARLQAQSTAELLSASAGSAAPASFVGSLLSFVSNTAGKSSKEAAEDVQVPLTVKEKLLADAFRKLNKVKIRLDGSDDLHSRHEVTSQVVQAVHSLRAMMKKKEADLRDLSASLGGLSLFDSQHAPGGYSVEFLDVFNGALRSCVMAEGHCVGKLTGNKDDGVISRLQKDTLRLKGAQASFERFLLRRKGALLQDRTKAEDTEFEKYQTQAEELSHEMRHARASSARTCALAALQFVELQIECAKASRVAWDKAKTEIKSMEALPELCVKKKPQKAQNLGGGLEL